LIYFGQSDVGPGSQGEAVRSTSLLRSSSLWRETDTADNLRGRPLLL